ncbi:hypothetical protein GTR02_04970 [Kineococcus sp. R8]|uniref:FIST signal transduction protein n=1 Tax=Kineococcus siccus TaxID=2696567 RepID=UPI001412BCCA|nr:FIST N-terminal domain-containing protein [Kineococcus siccus]NAZ81163.1 hypothetical protein [Kineococcus siccus]
MASWRLDLTAVLAGVRAAGGDAAVVGTSTGTAFARSGTAPSDIVVTALGGPGISVRTAASTDADADRRGTEVAAAALRPDKEHVVLLLLGSGTDGRLQDVVQRAYTALGPGVPLVGGGSDGDIDGARTWQFHGDDVLQDGLVGAAISSDRPLGVGCAHGLARVGLPLVVTSSDGTLVHSLDGRPALDVYLERLRAAGALPPGPADPDLATLLAAGAPHPLGLSRRRADVARTLWSADLAARTLTFVSPLPQGSAVHVMSGDHDAMLAGAQAACTQAVDGLAGAPAQGMVVFSCVARRGLLGDGRRREEVAAARTATGGEDVALTFSVGEVARVSGAAGCHNQTVVALAV